MLCLWRGLRMVFRKAGQEPKTGAAGALVAGYALAPAPVRLSDRWAAALWEEDGASYSQPLDFRYGRVRYDGFAELAYHGSDHSGYYADFSLPANGEYIRGYPLWTVRPDAAQETWFNYTCNYIRRNTLFSYPYQLPSEYARTLGLNHDGYSIFFGVSACDIYQSGWEGHLEAP